MPQAFADAGVDVVLSWHEVTYSSHELFVGFLLEEAYKQKQDGDYPTVEEALESARVKLVAAMPVVPDGDWNDPSYVWKHKNITGAQGEAAAKDIKLYPPRYGAKDNQ